jgi:hypothetical protein
VQIYKTGGDHRAFNVNHPARFPVRNLAHRRDFAPFQGYISLVTGAAGAIHDPGVA